MKIKALVGNTPKIGDTETSARLADWTRQQRKRTQTIDKKSKHLNCPTLLQDTPVLPLAEVDRIASDLNVTSYANAPKADGRALRHDAGGVEAVAFLGITRAHLRGYISEK